MGLIERILTEATEPNDLSGFVTGIKFLVSEYNDKGVELDIRFRQSSCELNLIRVNEKARGKGLAKEFMQKFIKLGDQHGVIIFLTPSDSFGSNVNKLKLFYKSFGFVDNKGKNKDYRFMASMIRYPKQ